MMRFHLHGVVLVCLLCTGCARNERPAQQETESAPVVAPDPRLDESFLRATLGPGRALANRPLLLDLDRQSGREAVVVAHKAHRDYLVAVVRGNQEVLATIPLGGKILAQVNIQAVGELKPVDLFNDGVPTFVLPVETLVYHQSVCGLLAFRYRSRTLSVVGEFSCRCWRREAGGDGSDPHALMTVEREGWKLTVQTIEPEGKRRYLWDEKQQAFISTAAPAKAQPPRRSRPHRRRARRKRR